MGTVSSPSSPPVVIVEASVSGDVPGGYESPARIGLGETYDGRVDRLLDRDGEVVADRDAIGIQLDYGTTYVVDLDFVQRDGASSRPTTFLRLYGPDFERIDSNSFNLREFRPVLDGLHFFVVEAKPAWASYALTVTEKDWGPGLIGDEMANLLIGTEEGEIIRGLVGDDTIEGRGGADEIFGDVGSDSILGGAGDDTILADPVYGTERFELGDNTIRGGEGDDSILGGEGNDSLFGDAGNDTLRSESKPGFNGPSSLLDGGAGNDELWAGDGKDTLRGGDGNDVLWAGLYGATLEGGAGDDTLWGDPTGLDRLDGGGGNDLIMGRYHFDTLIGGAGNDTLIADARDPEDDFWQDNPGRFSLDGGEGDDSLVGSAGADTLRGGDGDDWLDGGGRGDRMTGGAGNDTYVVNFITAGNRDVVYEEADGGIDKVILRAWTVPNYVLPEHVERLSLGGGPRDLQVIGNAVDERFEGNAWGTVFVGRGGQDTVTGGEGADTFVLHRADGAESRLTVTDFGTGRDRLALDDGLFGIGRAGIDPRDLGPELARALLRDGLVAYDAGTGLLSLDRDGDGVLEVAADLGAGTRLTLDDVQIF